MKTEKELVEEIMSITSKIQRDFPELSVHLPETPVKVDEKQSQEVSTENLIEYLNSLLAIYDRFSKNDQDK